MVAMSGGVDSSVAACLLREQGYEVVGLFMRLGSAEKEHHPLTNAAPDSTLRDSAGVDDRASAPSAMRSSASLAHRTRGHLRLPVQAAAVPRRPHQGCCSAADAADARYVAGMLDIPFYALNFQRDFENIIDNFADEYARGRTPNPCVMCNQHLKFGRLFEYADSIGADFVATGHYARIVRGEGDRGGQAMLARGRDHGKDQSYVLFGIRSDRLDRILFPIGDLEKKTVREIAKRYRLPNQDKPDSVEICFAPDRNYAPAVRKRRPDAFRPGMVVAPDGTPLGAHEGIGHFTIGQRRGLGIALGKPAYVMEIRADSATVVLGGVEDLCRPGLRAERVNFLAEAQEVFRAEVKIRYLHAPQPATVHRCAGSAADVCFDEPQRAITPGQAAVFYDGDCVIGGGWISKTLEDGDFDRRE